MHWPHSTTVPLLELKRIHFHIVLELLKEREREREGEREEPFVIPTYKCSVLNRVDYYYFQCRTSPPTPVVQLPTPRFFILFSSNSITIN